MVRITIFIILLLCIISQTLPAQQEREQDQNSFAHLEKLYRHAAGPDRRYINGSEYQDVYPGSTGHQFFLTENWYFGQLVMENRAYKNLPLKYDQCNDQLLCNHIHSSGSYVVVLNRTRIDSFIIEGHVFCKLAIPDGTPSAAGEGFYELLSKGKASFYQKWEKRYSEPSQHSGGSFFQFREWYILNENKYYRVKRKKGLLKALGDREKEIRSFIRENRVIFVADDKAAVKKVVDYYNSLQ